MRRMYSASVLALPLLWSAGCAQAQGDDQETPAQTAQPAGRVVNVETITIAPSTFTDYIRITGQAEAFHEALISAEESGAVVDFLVDKGSVVQKGDTIARIDDGVLSAQAAEAAAASALAAEQYERQRRLWEDEGIGTEINFLQAKYQSEIAVARLQTLQSRLAKLSIQSPIDGVFEEKHVDVGELVLPGTPIARVVSVNRIKITGGVPERFAAVVKRGSEARITFDFLPAREFIGRINYVASSVNEQNRTFTVEVTIENPGRLVKPRMVANVQLVRSLDPDAVVVPQETVLRGENGYHVFVTEDRDGTTFAVRREVEVGSTYGGRVQVTSGLQNGDQLITLGAQLVEEGSRVRVLSTANGLAGGAR